jgi:VIT1/CCC1 family predicted Fe2+/Mn2+ transporter
LAGAEGGLATTSAVACGILISLDQPKLVLLSVAVSFFVQAFNTSVGWFLIEETEEELERPRGWRGINLPLHGALVQFSAHILSSLIVILPLVLIADEIIAITVCAGVALMSLLGLGALRGRLLKTDPVRDALETVGVGAGVIAVGILSGLVLA